MFKNFIIITLRSFRTNKVYAFINIFGLAVGFASALLISIYVIHELSFDSFHKDSNRIFRVTTGGKLKGKDLNIAMTSAPMAKILVQEINEIESATRITRFGAWLVSNDTIRFNEDNFLFVDSNFFNLFSFRLIQGNPDSAFSKPRSIVLTQSAAKRYFGDENPVGRKLKVETDSILYTVTGLMDDVPSNSHFHFDMLGSLSTFDKYLNDIWVSHNVYTYIKIKSGTKEKIIEKEINKLVPKYVIPQVQKYLGLTKEAFSQGKHEYHFNLQPLKRIHLYSDLEIELENNGNALYVYTFAIIALLILIIACLNFINLSTANSANRAKEVVLRKIVGSEKQTLILQFLTESVLFSFIALVLAFLLAELAIPYFNRYLDLKLTFSVFNNVSSILIILMFAFVLGILAGTYPAFFIASYDPVKVFHGVLNKGIKNKQVRSVFVIFQFFISILFIILSLVVFAQVDFMLNKELGFEKDRIVVIRRSDALKNNLDNFKKEILKNPNIESVTNSNSIPGRDFWTSTFKIENDTNNENILTNLLFVNYDFKDAFKLTMVKGRFFDPKIQSDSNACVINETAANVIGGTDRIGQHLLIHGFIKKKGLGLKIIGIVKDFHFKTVDKAIEPLVISLMPGNWEGYLNIRLNASGLDKSVNFLEETWSKYTTEYPFVYFFLDKDFDRNYRSVINTGRILLIFSILSLFVACLGLFGLVSFTSHQRTREIGIRKAIGANYYQIIYLLIKETLGLLAIASVFAWSVAFLFSKLWLKEFYSRIQLSPKYFILASLIVLVMAIGVVLYQFFIAYDREPGEALKIT
jgi:putative ABC transport system permease protein